MQAESNSRLRSHLGVLVGVAVVLCVLSAGCDEDREVEPNAAASRVGDADAVMERGNRNGIAADPDWPRPRFAEEADRRRRMVDHIRRAYDFDDEAVLSAMMCVPRHKFAGGNSAMMSYSDTALSIGFDQTISQPYIVALMTSVLELGPDSKVLEIGTGSGYQAAVLSELTPHVYTIEIVEPLGRRAAKTFADLGYSTIKTRIGDGYKGWPEAQPFDAIVVTCAPESIPDPLTEQLKPGGRMIIPVGSSGAQELVLVTKNQDGDLSRENVLAVRFVPMTGEVQKK